MKNAEDYYNEGRSFYNNNQFDKAIECLNKAIELNPNYAQPYNGLGAVYKKLKQYEYSIKYLTKAINLDPTYADPRHGLGNVYADLEQYTDAIMSYKEAIELDPNYSYAYYNLGRVCKDLKKFDKAIDYLNKAIELDSNCAVFHYGLGTTYSDLKQYEYAITHLIKAIQLDSSCAQFYHNLGHTYFNLKQFEEAITYFNKAIELDPNADSSHHGLATIYNNFNQLSQAIIHFDKAIELNPNSFYSHVGLGHLYDDKLKQYNKAIICLNKGIQLTQDEILLSVIYGNLGNIYWKSKQYDLSITYFNKAIDLNPNDAPAYDGLGKVFQVLGKPAQAIASYCKAIELKPDFVSPNNGLGNLYAQLRYYDKAICYFFNAIKLNPNYVFSHHGLGNVYIDLKNNLKAAVHYRRAIFCDFTPLFEFFKHYTDFFHNKVPSPFQVKSLLDQIPNIHEFISYQELIAENQVECAVWQLYHDFWMENNILTTHARAFYSLWARVNYYMGNPLEAFRIYDAILDKETDDWHLTVQDHYYYLRSAESFLEPTMPLLSAAIVQIEQQQKNKTLNTMSAYYAGQIFYWQGNLVKANQYFQQAASDFLPAAYMKLWLFIQKNGADKHPKQIEVLMQRELNSTSLGFLQNILPVEPFASQKDWVYFENSLNHSIHYYEIAEPLQFLWEKQYEAGLFVQPPFWSLWIISEDEKIFLKTKIAYLQLKRVENALFEVFKTQKEVIEAKTEKYFTKKGQVEVIFNALNTNKTESLELDLGKEIETGRLNAHWYNLLLDYYYVHRKISIEAYFYLFYYLKEKVAAKNAANQLVFIAGLFNILSNIDIKNSIKTRLEPNYFKDDGTELSDYEHFKNDFLKKTRALWREKNNALD